MNFAADKFRGNNCVKIDVIYCFRDFFVYSSNSLNIRVK